MNLNNPIRHKFPNNGTAKLSNQLTEQLFKKSNLKKLDRRPFDLFEQLEIRLRNQLYNQLNNQLYFQLYNEMPGVIIYESI
jgi:hypothetical protein